MKRTSSWKHKFKLKKTSVAILVSALLLSGCGKSDKDAVESNTESVANVQQGKISKTVKQSNELNIEYQSITLDNGLEVIFHIDRSDPVVAVALTAHVGSARELPGRTGFAHLFEHLLFLESENLGKGGLDKMSARIGGSGANGSTSRDRTNYFQTVPKNALEKILWAEADKLGFFINTVTEQVLAKEKQVVKNEKRQGVDNNPYGHTQYVIDKNLYPEGHPYSWQVIGSLEDLQRATLQDVKDFFKRWYVPNNVSLVISGDFDEEQAKQWVHKYFDEIPSGKKVVQNKKRPVQLKESKRLSYEDNFARLPQLTLSWPTVPLYHADSYALNVLTNLLSDGKKAVMNQLLVDDLKLTSRVSMRSYESELAGQTSIRVRAFQNKNLNDVYDAIQKALLQFEAQGFSENDLARIKAEQETEFYRGLSSALGKGFQLAQYKIYKSDPGFINQDVKNILAVTKDDVLRVYNQYIKSKPYVATSFVPKGHNDLALKGSVAAAITEEKIVVGAEASFDVSKQSEYIKTPPTFDRTAEPNYDESPIVIKVPEVEVLRLENQLEVLSIQNNEVPLVNFELAIAGGMLFDSPKKIGVANLVARLMNRGTRSKTPQQLEEAIRQIGAEIIFSASKQSISVSGNSLSKNYQPMMSLMTEMLTEPRWDTIEFELAKESVISDIKQTQAQPRSVANIQYAKLTYGEGHLLANNLLGTESSIEKITLQDLKDYYQNSISPSLAKLHVVGDVSKPEIVQSLKLLSQSWGAKNITLPVPKPAHVADKAAVYFYDIPDAKQSMIRIGNPSLKAIDVDYYPAQVMNYRLGGGGFASKLTQELRESKGYTYGVRSSFSGSELTGQFTISSGVRSNVTLESVALIKEIMSNYQESYNRNDMQVTKGFFLKSNARRFETPDAKLNYLFNISQYGLPNNYMQQRAQQLEKIELADLKALAGKYIDPDKMIYLVVGDAETQMARLNELGLGDVILLNP